MTDLPEWQVILTNRVTGELRAIFVKAQNDFHAYWAGVYALSSDWVVTQAPQPVKDRTG